MRYLVNRAYDTSLKINYEPNDETRHNISTLEIWGELVGNKIINEGPGDISTFLSKFTETATFLKNYKKHPRLFSILYQNR